MTDRELLEKAAKAAGLGEVWYLDGSDTPYVGPRYELGRPARYSTFQPLTDDGDALRLAVKLGIYVGKSAQGASRFAVTHSIDDACYEEDGSDPYAATRRAIVRAAAALEDR